MTLIFIQQIFFRIDVMSDIPIPDKFLRPFVKVHLHQLNRASKTGKKWTVDVAGNNVTLDMVWVQGRVTSVNISQDILTLVDTSGGLVTVDDISSSPGGCDWVGVDQYIQVIGQVVNNNKVRCDKLTDLSLNKHCQQMWDLEVTELHNLLSDKVVFSEL